MENALACGQEFSNAHCSFPILHFQLRREVILLTLRKILLLAVLLSFISVGIAGASEAEKQLHILYTGDARGYIEGCG